MKRTEAWAVVDSDGRIANVGGLLVFEKRESADKFHDGNHCVHVTIIATEELEWLTGNTGQCQHKWRDDHPTGTKLTLDREFGLRR